MPRAQLRVVVDANELGDGQRVRGMGTALRHVLGGLAQYPDLEVVALTRNPDVTLPAGVTRRVLRRSKMRPRLARIEHDLRLPHDLRRARPDVVWSPANLPPRRSPAVVVQTVHDVIPLVLPHPLTATEARRWRRRAARVRAAAAVVASSRWSADQVTRLLEVDPARVEVVYLGVDSAYRPGLTQDTPPYLLTVAAWGTHKGFDEAAAVVGGLAEHGYPHTLRIAGPQDAWMRAQLEESLAGSSHPERVEILGWVDDLPSLYRGAAALLCTSRAEGFGLPLVEAMACGTPVVAFANSAVPEVVGTAGVLVDDGDVAAMVAAARRVIDDESLATELREAGLERARAFTWERTTAGYHDVLVAAGGAER